MYYSKFRVRPTDSPNSMLIWFEIVIERQHFEPIGITLCTQIDDIITMQTIGISGKIHKKSKNGKTITFTNGILLELTKNHNFTKISNFLDRAKMYSAKRNPTLIELQLESIEIKLYQNFIIAQENMLNMQCQTNKLRKHLLRSMLSSFPSQQKNYWQR